MRDSGFLEDDPFLQNLRKDGYKPLPVLDCEISVIFFSANVSVWRLKLLSEPLRILGFMADSKIINQWR